MFRVLYKKELMESVQNYRFLLALVLCLVVIPLGFYVSQKDYQERRLAFDERVRDYDQTRTTVIDLLRNGAAAFRPPAPLGFLSGGVETILPNSVEGNISDEGIPVQFNNARPIDFPFTHLFGRLDLTFIVSTVLAVLVMIFSFNAVAGEKERRTLVQTMANAVPRPLVITAKMAAGSTLLGVAFLAGTLAGVLLTAVLGLDPFRVPGTAAPFALAIGASLIFLLAFYSFGLLISSLSRSSALAMVILLSSWVALAMILPKGSVVAAKLLRPVKSQQVVDLEKNQVRLQIDAEIAAAVKTLAQSTPGIKDMSTDEYFKQLKANSPAVGAFEKAQERLKSGFTARLNAEQGNIDAELERQRGSQAALARNMSRLSPVSCLVHVMTELAGTGFVEEAAWRETRSGLQQVLDREIASKMHSYSFGELSYSGNDIDRTAPAPKFPPQPVSLDKRLAAVWIDLALLAIYGVLFFAGAYVAFLRYDVR